MVALSLLMWKEYGEFCTCDRLSNRSVTRLHCPGKIGVESIQCKFGHGKVVYTVSSTLLSLRGSCGGTILHGMCLNVHFIPLVIDDTFAIFLQMFSFCWSSWASYRPVLKDKIESLFPSDDLPELKSSSRFTSRNQVCLIPTSVFHG